MGATKLKLNLAITLGAQKMGILSNLFKPDTERLLKKKDVRGLIGALEHSDEMIRRRAAEALGQLESPEALEPLIVALNDPIPNVRAEATYSLGKLGDSRAKDPLVTVLNDKDKLVRRAAAISLGKLRDHRAVAYLISLLNEEDEQAVFLLGESGELVATSSLIGLLQSKKYEVCAVAAEALGKLRSQEAVKPLIAAVERLESEYRDKYAERMQRQIEAAGHFQADMIKQFRDNMDLLSPESDSLVNFMLVHIEAKKHREALDKITESLKHIGGTEAEQALIEYDTRHKNETT